jgi:hypothetical protein
VVLLEAWRCHFTHINLPGADPILNKHHWSSLPQLENSVHTDLPTYMYTETKSMENIIHKSSLQPVWCKQDADLEENVAENTELTKCLWDDIIHQAALRNKMDGKGL